MSTHVLAWLLAAGTALAAASGSSAPLAHELDAALQTASLDAFAAADPAEPGRFVAVLRSPGQLLVVSALHPSAAAVEQRIAQKMYRDVYLDLQGTPTPKGKLFVMDADANGITVAGEGSVDVVYRDGSMTILLNDDAKGQKLTEAQYKEAAASADADYAHALGVLKMALAAPAGGEKLVGMAGFEPTTP